MKETSVYERFQLHGSFYLWTFDEMCIMGTKKLYSGIICKWIIKLKK